MIVFASFCPHPPILIPSIGKENTVKLKKTADAYGQLEQGFTASRPDTVVIVSPHGIVYKDAFSINLCDNFFGGFEEFGDFSIKTEYPADYLTIERAQRHLRNRKIAVKLDTCAKLDHGVTVPLYLLAKNWTNFKLVPIVYSGQGLKSHFEFGQELKEALAESNDRVAVIASGDLSHSLTSDAPAGYNEFGKQFDDKILELVANQNSAAMIGINEKMIDGAHACGLRSLVMLFGILHGTECQSEILSYEAPFGVGYLVCRFKFA
ncbi:MAG: AmmeMemoRadiSam system protein B [Patescibacteria group bacterium]|nr:AmmeMemoRadiSam system protein B [Patescibacteria group bacterium]